MNLLKKGGIFKESNSEDRNTEARAIQNKIGTQSLRDTLSFMKRSRRFFKLVEEPNGNEFWKGVLIKPLGENRVEI